MFGSNFVFGSEMQFNSLSFYNRKERPKAMIIQPLVLSALLHESVGFAVDPTSHTCPNVSTVSPLCNGANQSPFVDFATLSGLVSMGVQATSEMCPLSAPEYVSATAFTFAARKWSSVSIMHPLFHGAEQAPSPDLSDLSGVTEIAENIPPEVTKIVENITLEVDSGTLSGLVDISDISVTKIVESITPEVDSDTLSGLVDLNDLSVTEIDENVPPEVDSGTLSGLVNLNDLSVTEIDENITPRVDSDTLSLVDISDISATEIDENIPPDVDSGTLSGIVSIGALKTSSTGPLSAPEHVSAINFQPQSRFREGTLGALAITLRDEIVERYPKFRDFCDEPFEYADNIFPTGVGFSNGVALVILSILVNIAALLHAHQRSLAKVYEKDAKAEAQKCKKIQEEHEQNAEEESKELEGSIRAFKEEKGGSLILEETNEAHELESELEEDARENAEADREREELATEAESAMEEKLEKSIKESVEEGKGTERELRSIVESPLELGQMPYESSEDEGSPISFLPMAKRELRSIAESAFEFEEIVFEGSDDEPSLTSILHVPTNQGEAAVIRPVAAESLEGVVVVQTNNINPADSDDEMKSQTGTICETPPCTPPRGNLANRSEGKHRRKLFKKLFRKSKKVHKPEAKTVVDVSSGSCCDDTPL